jgi:glutamate racemase
LNNYTIGIFDSGFGGLTIMKEIVKTLPDYDYIYLGDNARAPYGSRSFETVYRYTLEAVNWLFKRGCYLVIIACNTASAKALRTIQQKDLLMLAPEKRVLGVIRPVTEIIDSFTKTQHVGLFGTLGTVNSLSYVIEIAKSFPGITVTQEACPMWVPLIENNEFNSDGACYFIKKHVKSLIEKDILIDAVVLGCTHYPLILDKIRNYLPSHIEIVNQGTIVADSLVDYLRRHPEIDRYLGRDCRRSFFTTDNSDGFDRLAQLFYGEEIRSTQVGIENR